jgi:hypothetical protein
MHAFDVLGDPVRRRILKWLDRFSLENFGSRASKRWRWRSAAASANGVDESYLVGPADPSRPRMRTISSAAFMTSCRASFSDAAASRCSIAL